MAEGTTEDASSGYRDSIVTYSTNAEDSSGVESDSTSQRDSYTTDNSSQADNFHNSNSEAPRTSKNLNNDDEDDEDDPKRARTTPFYKNKRFWAIFCVLSIVFSAIMIPVALLVIFPAIVQKTMDRADINIENVLITNPQEGSFQMNMKGSVTDGGPYNAKVEYPDPVDVYYQGSLIGSMNLDNMNIKGGNAVVDSQDKLFTIKDPDSLIAFTGGIMLSESVEWELKGNVKITALGLTKNHLKLDKKIVLNGANGFQNTTVKSLIIQQNTTTNTLDLAIVATMFNPSPFGMQLGILQLEVYYNSTLVAPVTTDPFTLVSGENEITMRGSIVPPTTDEDRANFESFMVSFINGKDGSALTKGVSAKPDSVNTVSWLNTIVKNLQLNAKLSAKTPSQIITSVDFGDIKMTFNVTDSYAPLISSNGTTASYQLPFQVNLQVNQVTQNISIYTQNMVEIASLVTGNSTASNDASKIYINIPPSPFVTAQTDVGKQNFQDFLKNLTIGKSLDLNVIGTSDVSTNTVIGPLTLRGVPLNTTTTLTGFQGFTVKPPTISNLTVIGGTQNGLNLSLNVDLFNPTNYSLDLGSVSFQMIYEGQVIGIATIPDLALHPADTILPVVATLDPNGNDAAKEILNSYINGTTTTLQIAGYNGSSTIESLSSALTALTISSELPPLGVKLLGKSSLDFSPDIITSGGVAKASIEITNPFAVDFSISSIQSTLGYDGEELGVLNLDHLSSPIALAKNSTSVVHDLPVKLNIEPSFLFGVLRQSAQDAGLDLTPIDVLLTLGGFTNIKGFKPIDLSKVDPSIFKNFNVIDYAKKALSAMLIDINMVSTITIGDYSFELAYVQYGISTSVGDSISILVDALSTPIVQKLMDASSMSFDKIFIQDPSETAFTSSITGTVSNTGPFDATISFPNGVSLSSNNVELGTMTLPDITSSGGQASLNNLQSQFSVTNTKALADFTIQVLMTESANWTMSAQNVVVNALGLSVSNISLVKSVTLTGSNGFQNGTGIKLLNFTLVGPVPQGGVASAISISLTNDATLGVELGTINYNVYYNGTFIGPAESDNSVMLPHATSIMNIGNRILPPTTQQQQELLSGLFKLLLAGETVSFQTVGDSVVTKNGPVSWLSAAIQKMNIVLPIQGPKVQDESVLTVDTSNIAGITPQSFDIHMVGAISKTGPLPVTLSYPSGVDVFYGEAQIGNVKMAPVDLIPNNDTKLDSDGPFSITNVQAMTVFTGDLLGKESLEWELKTNDMTVTFGGIPITGMPFDKQVGFLGFNGLKDGIQLNNITFGLGKNKELDLTINTTIINPSNTGIEMGTIVFDTFVEDKPLTPITAQNVVLAPKTDNEVIFTGEITDISVLLLLLQEKQPAMKVVGKSVDPPKAGGEPVPWLQIPFSQLEFPIPIDPKFLPDFTKVIQSIQINDMSLIFTPQTAFDPSSSSKSIVATVKMPMPLPIKTVQEDIVIIDEDNTAVATLKIPPTPVTINPDGTMTLSYQNIPLTAVDPGAFAKFILELTAAVDKSFSLVGNVTTDALPFPIPFNVKSSLPGLQGLKSSPVTLGQVAIKEGTAKSLNLLTTVTLANPSNVQIDAGGAAFGIFAGDAQVSTAVISDLKLAKGPNTLPTEVQIPPAKGGDDIVALFLGNFLAGGKSPLNIKNGVTDVKSLQPTFALLQLDTVLDGLPKQLINSVKIDISSSSFAQDKAGTATLSVTNYLNKDVTIDSVDLTISDTSGKVIATAKIPALPQKPILKTGQPTDLPIPVTIEQDVVGMSELAANGEPKTVNVVLISGISIESHDTTINYKQDGVPSTSTGSSGVFKQPSGGVTSASSPPTSSPPQQTTIPPTATTTSA